MLKYVGIDISKDKFDVAFPGATKNAFTSQTFLNEDAGIAEFISLLQSRTTKDMEFHLILEATGVYSLTLSHQLVDHGFRISVINPLKSKRFSQTIGQEAKTDAQDAIMLSIFGERMQPKPAQLPDDTHYKVKQKRLYIKQLKKGKQVFTNHLHALEIHPIVDGPTLQRTKKQIEQLDQEIKEAEKDLQTFTKEEYQEQFELITSIKGIGDKNAIALIYATNGFKSFQHPKQFARFVGICPTVYESGSSVRRRSRMNRSGDPDLRRLLYIASWSAIRYNAPCKQKYEQLIARGKPSMVALVAVMNKLVRQAFGVIKNKQKFDNEYEKERLQNQAA